MPMQSETEAQVVANGPPMQSAFSGRHRARLSWLATVVVFLAVAGILVSGILLRVRARAAVTAETAAMAVPVVNVVSVRKVDVGDLINSGSAPGTRTDLFHIAQPGKLRVYVYVPQEYSQAAAPGLTAELTLAEFPGRRFPGKLVRTANAINNATRTLQAEVDVDNPTGKL